MKSCLDCLNCKIYPTKSILRCKEGQWRNKQEREIAIKLKKREARSLRIEHRQIFLDAEYCPSIITIT